MKLVQAYKIIVSDTKIVWNDFLIHSIWLNIWYIFFMLGSNSYKINGTTRRQAATANTPPGMWYDFIKIYFFLWVHCIINEGKNSCCQSNWV